LKDKSAPFFPLRHVRRERQAQKPAWSGKTKGALLFYNITLYKTNKQNKEKEYGKTDFTHQYVRSNIQV